MTLVPKTVQLLDNVLSEFNLFNLLVVKHSL